MSNGAATRRRRSHEKIIAAAEREFLQSGFLGTNMDAVAETAGVSKQTVYAHFKSKEALFIEVVVAMTGGAARELGEDIDAPPEAPLVQDFLLKTAIDQLTVVLTPRLMRLRRMVIGEVERFPELGRSLYENGPAAAIGKLERAFAHYRRIGQLVMPDPLMAATQFNWLLMGGPTSAAMLLGDLGIPKRFELEAHAAECARIFLCAYGAGNSTGN